ncbi:MAG: tetratricopeptide repeat protein [Rhodospirillaceae bacterium]
MATTFLGRILAGLILLVALWPAAADARWMRGESSKFIIYSEGEEPALREFISKLHEFDDLLRRLSNASAVPAANKFTIYLLRHNGELREVFPSLRRSTAGVYAAYPRAAMAFAIRVTPGTMITPEHILFHEYAHHFMLHYHPATYPAWFTEGFAEYFSTVEFMPGILQVGGAMPGRAYELLDGSLGPSARVLAPRGKIDYAREFHAHSWLIVHYMLSDPERRRKMMTYLASVARGEDLEKAFVAAFDMDFAAFDAVLRGYLKKGKVVGLNIPRKPVPVEIKVDVLPPSADSLLLAHARLQYEVPGGEEDFLASVRRRSAKFPDDVLAIQTLASAEMILGDATSADAALAKLESLDPSSVQTPFLKALRYLMAGVREPERRAELWAQVKAPAAQAHKRDPNHYPSLYLYALAVLENGATPNENTLNVLALAHQLAPQVSDIKVELGIAFYRTGRVKEGIAVLQTLANSPHENEKVRRARSLIAQMEAGAEVPQQLGDFDADED